jgi:hypothetical protein
VNIFSQIILSSVFQVIIGHGTFFPSFPLKEAIMESQENLKRNSRYNYQGIGTITALLTIIALSIIFVSILSVL